MGGAAGLCQGFNANFAVPDAWADFESAQNAEKPGLAAGLS
jgi:hypothetical protein